MTGDKIAKDPDAVLDYQFNWAEWLTENDSDTIFTSTLIVPTGIIKDSDTKTTTTATIWLSGGTLGEDYDITNRIVTAGGRTEDRTMTIKVRAR